MPIDAMKRSDDHRELILQTWIDSGKGAVTTKVLRRIQRALAQSDSGSAVSPASIARILADVGAELRHPDVIEFDARWREKRVKQSALHARNDLTKPLTLKT